MSKSPRDNRIAQIRFASVYPHYVSKVQKKGTTIAELHRVIQWLTGFDEAKLRDLMAQDVTFEQFFRQARLNRKARQITGTICGHRVEEIENPLTRKIRYLDKLVDELARGWPLERVLREQAKS